METKPITKTTAIAIFLAFTMSYFMRQPKTVTKEIPAPPASCDYTQWRELKTKDDVVINKAGAGYQICADLVKAALDRDVAALEKGTKAMETMALEVTELGNERMVILSELGY